MSQREHVLANSVRSRGQKAPGRDLKGQLGLYAKASIEIIWLPGTFLALISGQFHKNTATLIIGLCLGSDAGKANDFKPRELRHGPGWAHGPELAYMLVACWWPAVKRRGRGCLVPS